MATPLIVPPRLLLGPGPSLCAPEVLRALATPLLGHLDPAFLRIMDATKDRLRELFKTTNRLTLPLPGTGSAGTEAIVVNFIEPGERVIVGVNGVFGGRLADQARRIGARVETIDVPFGEAIPAEAVESALEREPAAAVIIVHAETSTGVLQPDIARMAAATRRVGGLFLLDCVTSLGGTPVEIDAWGVDAAYSGTQKCLSVPPGLAPATFGERAVAKLKARRTPVPSWYLDLGMIDAYWGSERAYHHTAPISMVYALHEGLGLLLDEGLEASFARHLRVRRFLDDALASLDLRPVVPEAIRLPMLTSVAIPEGVDDAGLRRDLYERFNIEIGGGLGPLKGKVWRIGLMGYGAREENVLTLTGALRDLIPRHRKTRSA